MEHLRERYRQLRPYFAKLRTLTWPYCLTARRRSTMETHRLSCSWASSFDRLCQLSKRYCNLSYRTRPNYDSYIRRTKTVSRSATSDTEPRRGKSGWLTTLSGSRTYLQMRATIIGALPHRNYQLRTTAGSLVRRNGMLLHHPLLDADVSRHPGSGAHVMRCRVREQQPSQQPAPPVIHLPGATRSGRVPWPPNRLTL
jgi:hypothetical protein